jgi:hypothetical protein
MVVFVIVGKNEPIYQAELASNTSEELAYLHQFILHASLDVIQSTMWMNNAV